MKNAYLLFAFLLASAFAGDLFAQDYEIRARTAGPGLVAVDVRFVGAGPNPMAVTDALLDFTVDLRYPAAAGLDYVSLDNTGGYGIQRASVEQVDGDDEFVGFALSVAPVFLLADWERDEWIEIFTATFDGDASPDEIVAIGALGSNPFNANIPNLNMSGPDFTPAIVGSANLPVELADFAVARVGAASATLNWTTEREENTSHFEVERSTNTQDWTVIATVDANGNSETALDYLAYDKDIALPVRNAGTVFYRLHIIDFDGHTEYSPVKTIAFEPMATSLTVYPNPTTDLVTVQTAEELVSVTLLDQQGRQLTTTNLNQLDLSGFPVGAYGLRIETVGGVETRVVVRGR
ncbi:T9SS type A sorting domain-containing protein [Lewinella sp. 4G2]|uniref:T9SS type A sorting domain-containing protein n=1 Tax=Lewinella sp. 4G2 TaxID=1803372 RepID=UPI0007B4B2F0|nr:T9SS type A sorting domain-containing protein [Lewinella sp. 4G2]OAV43654.1 hypothetical protein A3850_003695 [Lewinella sp. 4G2]